MQPLPAGRQLAARTDAAKAGFRSGMTVYGDSAVVDGWLATTAF
jgi:hypothetical protein